VLADKPVDEVVNVDAVLDALADSPTSSDVYEATLPFSSDAVAAAAARRSLGGGGGGSETVLSATFTLTNTQIKNLSTGVAPFATAVAAPGAGRAVIPIFWIARAHVVTGYTNRDANSSIYPVFGDQLTDTTVHIDAAPLLDAANDALACVGVPYITGIEVSPYLENQPLYLYLNSNSGALTGGGRR
jgi:hypothetical protein